MRLSSSMLGLNSQKMICWVSTTSFLTTLTSWTISTASRLFWLHTDTRTTSVGFLSCSSKQMSLSMLDRLPWLWSVGNSKNTASCATPNFTKSTTTLSWPLKISRQLSLEQLTLFQSLWGLSFILLKEKSFVRVTSSSTLLQLENLQTCTVWLPLVKKACSVSCLTQQMRKYQPLPTLKKSLASPSWRLSKASKDVSSLHPLPQISSVSSKQQMLLLKLDARLRSLVVLWKRPLSTVSSLATSKLLREPLSSQMKSKTTLQARFWSSVQVVKVSRWQPSLVSLTEPTVRCNSNPAIPLSSLQVLSLEIPLASTSWLTLSQKLVSKSSTVRLTISTPLDTVVSKSKNSCSAWSSPNTSCLFTVNIVCRKSTLD